jgi:hypothetical protein
MLAYQDLLDISPYQELFKEEGSSYKPSGYGYGANAAKSNDPQQAGLLMAIKALSQMVNMFGGPSPEDDGQQSSSPYDRARKVAQDGNIIKDSPIVPISGYLNEVEKNYGV